MSYLHYGNDVRIALGSSDTRQVMEAVAAHATRGGWVTLSDVDGREWSILVTAGIPIWVTEEA